MFDVKPSKLTLLLSRDEKLSTCTEDKAKTPSDTVLLEQQCKQQLTLNTPVLKRYPVEFSCEQIKLYLHSKHTVSVLEA